MLSLRLRQGLSCTLAATVLLLISIWRSQPAFIRDFYAMESGSWLIEQWTKGFWHCLTHIRPDYLTAANQMVIGLANEVTCLGSGNPLAVSGPSHQHWVATLYVALIFIGIWWVVRSRHGSIPALAVTALAFLMPDADTQHYIFGEAASVGFFSLPAVIFVYYDLMDRQAVGRWRLLIGAAVLVLSIFTSPLAALTSAGLAVMLGAVRFRELRRPSNRWLLIVHAIIVLLCIGVVLHGVTHNPYEYKETATMDASLRRRFVELLFGRQLGYPVLMHVYRDCTDAISLLVSALLVAVVAGVAWLGGRRHRSSPDAVMWWAGVVLLIIAASAGAVTIVVRKEMIVEFGGPYSPAQSRYFLAQNMLVVMGLGITLLNAVRLFPKLRSVAVVGFTLAIIDFASLQQERLEDYIANRTPGDASRAWRSNLARAVGMQRLTGDWQQAAGMKDTSALSVATLLAAPVNRLNVPFGMLQEASSKGDWLAQDDWKIAPCAAVDIATSDKPWSQGLTLTSAALCAREKGLLILCSGEATEVRVASDARKVWVAGVPSEAQFAVYSSRVRTVNAGYSKAKKPPENGLLQVAIFVPGGMTAEALDALPQQLRIAVGRKPGEALASASLASLRGPLGWSSLQTDSTFALRMHHRGERTAWLWNRAEVEPHHVVIAGDEVQVQPLHRLPFDERAYVQLNRDVDTALAAGAVTSARAHYDTLGIHEGRETMHRSLRIVLESQALTTRDIDGIAVELRPSDRKESPSALRITMHGASGESASLVLTPVEATKDAVPEFRACFLRQHLRWPDFRVTALELGFMGMPEGGKLRVLAVKFLGDVKAGVAQAEASAPAPPEGDGDASTK